MTEQTRCPICGKPSAPAFRPFCSRRCADVDLGRWFSGDYRVPEPIADEEDEKSRKNDDLLS